jgi:hypothetical protein
MTKTTYRATDTNGETADFDRFSDALIEVAEWEETGTQITEIETGKIVAIWIGETFEQPVNGYSVDEWEDILFENAMEEEGERRYWNQDADHRRFATAMGYR